MMKQKHKGLLCGFAALCLAVSAVMGLICYYDHALSDSFCTARDEQVIAVASNPTLQIQKAAETKVQVGVVTEGGYSVGTAKIKLFGIIPVKEVALETTARKQMQLGGKLFGIKLYTDGVLVVGIDKVTTDSGRVSPGKEAGLQVGDSILTADGKAVCSNEELRQIITAAAGKPIALTVRRGESRLSMTLQPAYAVGGVWRGGIWVKDSTAGIGTLTCYDAATGVFVGLGHGIYDPDTKTLLHIAKGEICSAVLTGIKKGQNGTPGQLEGIFTEGILQGELLSNTENGISGVLKAEELMQVEECEMLPIAYKQEITVGKAYLCCRFGGESIEEYEVEIEKVDLSDGKESKNFVIHVTDERLLEKTGGIVQGMSGSPLVQNGRIIGAVTHVFVGDSTRGYGIFIENMLDAVA